MSISYKIVSIVTLPIVVFGLFMAAGSVQAQSTANRSTVEQERLDGLVGPGDRGEQVRLIQELLAQHTDLYPEGLVTGYYGDLTAQAVSRLQAEAGLPQVGRVGQETFDYLLSISQTSDDGGEADDDRQPERETITLTDQFMGAYEFTATVTRMTDTTWQYTVEGSVPSPNYNVEVLNDGPLIVASIEQTPGAAPTVVSDVRDRGRLSVDSDTEAEDIQFEVRGDADSGEAQEPIAQLSVTPDTSVETGERFRVDASGSSDPNGDALEYSWNVDTPRGAGGGGYSDRSGIQTSFDTPGTASFEVTVRDGDGNTDSESVEVMIGDGNESDQNRGPNAQDDSYSITAGDSINVSEAEGLLANDSDPNGDELEVTDINQVSNYSGVTLDPAGAGAFYLRIDEDYEGEQALFRYTATDGEIDDSARIVVNVRESEDTAPSDAQLILDRTVGEIDEFPADDVLMGDVDQNGSITAGDAGLIQDYLDGDAELNFRQKSAADVDGDGEITAEDNSQDLTPVDPPVGQPTLPGPEEPRNPGGVRTR